MKNLLMFAKRTREMQMADTQNIVQYLRTFCCDIYIDIDGVPDTVYVQNPKDVAPLADALIVLGGDGSLLGVARSYAQFNKPILGINLGRLGYMVEIEKNHIEALSCLFSENYRIENRIMLNAKVIRNGETVFETDALNDMVVTKGALSRMVHLTLTVNGQFAQQYHADGVVVATPTGSTAYSMSAGGAIVSPELEVFLLTPVCPHAFNSKPLVVSDKQTIGIKAEFMGKEEVVLTADGQEAFRLQPDDLIEIIKSKYTTRLIRLTDRNFFHILKHKLEENR